MVEILLSEIIEAFSSSNISPDLTIFSPSITIFSEEVLPNILSDKGSIISSPSFKSEIVIPLIVLQLSSDTTTSCATSTNLLVKYPASAVFRAVSANPFLAPWVEIKYSITDKPSLKLDIIGLSIISPPPIIDFLGLAIRPLIPANCLIWSPLPLAPESAIIYTELKPSSSDFNPLIISDATSLVAFVQISITLLYLSPSVKMCLLNLF